jgi:hypothetical protein
MEDLFAKIIFAHVLGDYFLQPKIMALQKSEPSQSGSLWCALHSLIYTAAFIAFFPVVNPLFFALIFLSHYPLDRWSLAQKWLDLIGGRNYLKAQGSKDKYREIDISFSVVVYTVADNTLHVYTAWIILKMFF